MGIYSGWGFCCGVFGGGGALAIFRGNCWMFLKENIGGFSAERGEMRWKSEVIWG